MRASPEFIPHWTYIEEVLANNLKSDTIKETPIECLREWALIALRQRDLDLVGSSVSLAAVCGFSIEELMGSEGGVPSLASDLMSLFQTAAHHGAATTCRSTARQAPQRALHFANPAALESLQLPPCMNWVHETLNSTDLGPPKILLKVVSNVGEVRTFANTSFRDQTCSLERLATSLCWKQPPPYLHPDDRHAIGMLKGGLWKNLSPPVRIDEGAIQRTSSVELLEGVRLQCSNIHVVGSLAAVYRYHRIKSQLIVTNRTHIGQVSFHVIVFREVLRRPRGGAALVDDDPDDHQAQLSPQVDGSGLV